MPSPTWQQEFKRLWKELVPPQGQAKTVQGELIRAVGRLSDEAYRNGNQSFGRGHRMFCEFIRGHLKDPTVFSTEEMEEIDRCLDQILDSAHPDVRGPESTHCRLTQKVVRWCEAKPELIPHKPNRALRI